MAIKCEFTSLTIDGLSALATQMKGQGARFVQILGTNTEQGIDLTYSFMADEVLLNYQIRGVKKDDVLPSISEQFFSAFVFENEAHDLFGVNIENIAIDFGGKFYILAQSEPMTIISPEQKAAREKAAKAAAAKAARAAKAAAAKAAAEAEAKAAAETESAVPQPEAAPADESLGQQANIQAENVKGA